MTEVPPFQGKSIGCGKDRRQNTGWEEDHGRGDALQSSGGRQGHIGNITPVEVEDQDVWGKAATKKKRQNG